MARHELKKSIGPEPIDQVGDQYLRIPSGYEVVVDQAPPEEPSPRNDYLRQIWQRRWLVLLVLLACLAASYLLAGQVTPIYTATARIRLGLKTPNIMPFPDAGDRSPKTNENPVITQMYILQSRTIARQVVGELNFIPRASRGAQWRIGIATLLEKMVGQGKLPQFIKARLAGDGNAKPILATEEDRMQLRVDAFLAGFSVRPIPDTQIFEASYSSPDSDFSARALNALCDAYIKYDYQSKSDAYREAQRWLQVKLAEVKGKVTQSEESLYKFTGIDGGDYLMLSSNAQEYFKQLEELRVKIGAVEDEYNKRTAEMMKLKAAGFPDATGQGSGNAIVDQLRTQLANAEVEYDKINVNLGPLANESKSAAAAKERLSLRLSEEQQRLQKNARYDSEQSKNQLTQLKKAYDSRQKHIIDLQQRLAQYNILQRDVDMNRDMVNNLQQKVKEVSVAASVQPADVMILQRAERPLNPLAKEKNNIMLLGLFLGLSLSVGTALFLEHLDVTIKSGEDVWRLCQLPTLGFIPRCADLPAADRREMQLPLITQELPYSGIAESFRSLRTSVQYAFGRQAPKILLVSSLLPSEGKTMVGVNLAISFAQKGHKVLLIDADMKKPTLHKIFGLREDKGLSELLAVMRADIVSESRLDEHIFPTRVTNLSVIPSGSLVSNPTDLLDSQMMHQLLDYLSGIYEHIIIDSAPLLDLADSSVLAPHMDGVVLVVRPGITPRQAFLEVNKQLTAIGGQILGVVLNNPKRKMDPRQGRPDYHGYGRPPCRGGFHNGRRGESEIDENGVLESHRPYPALAPMVPARVAQTKVKQDPMTTADR